MTTQFPVTDAAAEAALTAITNALAGVLSVCTKNTQVTGSLTVADPTGVTTGSTVTINTDTLGALGIKLSGTPVGATVLFQGSVDGNTWDNPKAYPMTVGSAGVQSATAAGDFEVNCAAFKQFRVCLSALTSGSFAVVLNGTSAVKHVGVKNGNAADLQATVIPPAAVWIDRSGSINGTVLSAAVLAGNAGTDGTNGTQTVTGTTGTGTKFQASVTITGGAITAVNSISVPGLYTASPTNPASEPVTGAGLTGAILNLTMGGVATQVMAANPARRKLEFQPTSSTSADWALNKSGNGVTAGFTASGGAAAGSLQIAGMTGNPGRGDIYTDESTAAVFAYNATPFSTFTASEY